LQKINIVVNLHSQTISLDYFEKRFCNFLVYGVMVTQLFLVQSFKVRVLVDQQKSLQKWRLFLFLYFFVLRYLLCDEVNVPFAILCLLQFAFTSIIFGAQHSVFVQHSPALRSIHAIARIPIAIGILAM
jgi:hypothetical protein